MNEKELFVKNGHVLDYNAVKTILEQAPARTTHVYMYTIDVLYTATGRVRESTYEALQDGVVFVWGDDNFRWYDRTKDIDWSYRASLNELKEWYSQASAARDGDGKLVFNTLTELRTALLTRGTLRDGGIEIGFKNNSFYGDLEACLGVVLTEPKPRQAVQFSSTEDILFWLIDNPGTGLTKGEDDLVFWYDMSDSDDFNSMFMVRKPHGTVEDGVYAFRFQSEILNLFEDGNPTLYVVADKDVPN